MRYSSVMIHTDYAIERIKAYLQSSGMAKSRLAVEAGVPEGCTRRIEDKNWNPTTDTLRKLEAVVPTDFIFTPNKSKITRNGK